MPPAKHPFVHLHTHSHYSLLDGMTKIPDLVKAAKAAGMTALALTDHGAMYGAIEFFQECKKADIKPIVGVEAYVAARTRHDKDPDQDGRRYHLTLLAKNEVGYKNLMYMTSIANMEGFYYKPRMDKELFASHGEGVICLSGCPASEFITLIKNNHDDEAKELIHFYETCFSKGNVYIEIMKHEDVDWYIPLIPRIIAIAEELGLPLVGTWDSHYLHVDDVDAHDTLVAINTGADINTKKLTMKGGNYSFINSDEAYEVFKDIPGAYDNTSLVADSVDLEITLGKLFFPDYKIEGENADEMLARIAADGFKLRNMPVTKTARERLEYELGIIKMKGYASYFLVVADLLRYARENGILTNIRGSVAGSLTTYLLGITAVDPLEFNLPFERFLNPERPSAPDIDMDYADNRRDEMIEYAKRKYGEDRVVQIGTFGTMMARGSVRDVARALGYPYATGDRLSKMIPMGSQGFPMTIDHAMEMVPELKDAYDNERDTKLIIDTARRMEGCARHISVHAAGVVISPKPLWEFTPIQFDPKGGKMITQYDMYSIEDAGLPKFDFLGIRNLSILADSIKLVKKIFDIDVDLDTIPMDDKKSFDMLARGDTEGLFQLNGAGMTKWLKELRPSTIHDINAMVALYRPGPMQFIPDYIARKHNPDLIEYLDDALEPILKNSYGVLVYQDDLLIMAHDLAGYTWGEVDKFRKAVGKKIPEEMEAQREKFIKGCVATSGWSEKKATEIWKWIEPFAAYGFNKAHSASYGRVAYQTAYMKANFPVPYMTAILTAESGDTEKIATIINECKRMGIDVLPPNVNESFGGFTIVSASGEELIDSRTIRFGLYTVKNLGTDISDAIIKERKDGGPFSSIGDFLERIKHKNLNKKSLEALAMCGALDEFGERGELMANVEHLLEYNRELNKNASQTSLFGADTGISLGSLKLVPAEPATFITRLAWEKELLGLYVSGHPLETWRAIVEKTNTNIALIKQDSRREAFVMLAALIEDVKIFNTKVKNERMGFVRLNDFTGSIEAVAFPKIFKAHADLFISGKCVGIKAKLSERNGEKSLLIEEIKELGA